MNVIVGRDMLSVRLAETETDVRAAERLRYRVFIEECGGDGPMVDHEGRFERDHFDPQFDHLILVDARRDADALDHVVGVYRLMSDARAEANGGFYSEGEFDLEVLRSSGRKLLELGRSCVHPDYRDGRSLMRLWQGVGEYVNRIGAEILFGVASFHGTDTDALALPLAHLHDGYLAPSELCVRANGPDRAAMNKVSVHPKDRAAAMRAVPPLVKSYLRLGGFVGEGAYVDHAFNTTDICLVLDTARVSPEDRARYAGAAG